MSGEHVGEQTQGEGHGPGDEGREELQRDDEGKQVRGHPLGNESAFQKTDPELSEPGTDVDAPGQKSQAIGESDIAEGREHENKGFTEPVVDQQEGEQAEQIRQEAPVVVVENVTGDAIADEFVEVLGKELPFGGQHLEAARGQPPEQDHQQSRYDGLPEGFVHPGGGAGNDGSVEDEVVDARRGVTAIATAVQRKKPRVHAPLPYRLMIRYVLQARPRIRPIGSNHDVFQR